MSGTPDDTTAPVPGNPPSGTDTESTTGTPATGDIAPASSQAVEDDDPEGDLDVDEDVEEDDPDDELEGDDDDDEEEEGA
jgi:hypothetical protein